MNYAEARSKWDDMSDAVREVVACGGVIAAAGWGEEERP